MAATQTWVNAGPLTTIFVPAPTCSGNFLYSSGDSYAELNDFADDCYPTDFAAGAAYYYSPALCPSEWYSAYDYSQKFYGVPTLASAESAALCCPSDYTISLTAIPPPRLSQAICTSVLTGPVTARSCGICTSSFVVDPINPQGTTVTAYAFTLLIRWQSSDVQVLAAATSPQVTTSQASSTSSVSVSASPQVTPTTNSAGLSTDTKIGIGVGVTLFVILLIIIAVWVVIRHRKKQNTQNKSSDETETTVQQLDVNDSSRSEKTNVQVEQVVTGVLKRDFSYDREHLRLGRNSDEIRVLTIIPANHGDIECKLDIVKLKQWDDKAIIPLSYHWGNENPTEKITINGYDFPVRPNLYHALLHLRHRTERKSYWIDAICINQDASRDEKRLHLRHVPFIYSRNETVYVWLGKESEHSDEVMDHFGQSKFAWTGPAAFRKDYELNTKEWRWFTEDILQRPWFSRAWIVQEFIVANNVVFICGHKRLNWDVFANIFGILSEKAMQLTVIGSRHLWTAQTMVDLRHRGIRQYQRTVGMWIDLFGSQTCTDPEDSVLAFHGLATDRDAPRMQELFNFKTYEEVCRMTMQHILNVPRDKDFICAKPCWGLPRAQLPSWVPDFRSQHKFFVPRKGLFDPETSNGFDASQSDLRHRYTGAARQLIMGSSQFSFYSVTFTTVSSTKGPRYLARFQGRTVDTVKDLGTRKLDHDQSSKSALEAYIKHAIHIWMGQDNAEKLYPGSRNGDTYASAANTTLSFDIDSRLKLISREEALNTTLDDWKVKEFRLIGYKPMVTSHGRIGLVPRHAAVGDKICILLGCSLPIIVRDITEKERTKGIVVSGRLYTLIGPSYVHGIMFGEALTSKIDEEEFVTLK